MRIGLPQALLNYEFGDQYAAFFRELGATVVHSPVSNRQVLELGLAATVDEACLPVKLALGHVAALRDRCDLIFLPRIVSWRTGEYSCPELMGLPDVVRAGLGPSIPLLSPVIDLHHRRRSLLDIAREVAAPLTDDRHRIERALAVALATPFNAAPVAAARDHEDADVTIAVTGEPYVINDPLISLDLLARLRGLGAHVRTVGEESAGADAADAAAGRGAAVMPDIGVDRVPYWTLCRQSSKAVDRFLTDPTVDGLVHVECFGCGPGALVGEVIARRVWRVGNKPLLNLTVDEHTGEAGLVTRCEAFLDLIRWRRSR